MLLKLKITKEIAEKAVQHMLEEDMSYYSINQQRAGFLSPEFLETFGAVVNRESLRYGANKIGEKMVGWITSDGNALVIDTDQFVAIYCGVRHAIAPLWWLGNDFKSLPIIEQVSSMPWLKPWETLEEFCRRADKRSDNKYERTVALLREGKTLAFILAEGDLPLQSAKKMHQIAINKGYYK